MTELTWHKDLTAVQTGLLRELLLAVAAADGRPLVDELGPLPADLRGETKLFASDDTGALVGFAHLDNRGDAFGRKVADLFVHPDHRGRGVGSDLVRGLLRTVGVTQATADGDDRLRIWSHGDHPAAAKIAANLGLSRIREMHRMRLRTAGANLGEPHLPDGVRVRPFVPGTDENAVIEVNRKAFDWHPEQGAMSIADLIREENEDWFDAAGFFVAERTGAPESGLLGFHWTKVHRKVVADDSGLSTGEVYVVGVAPEAQGTGLGKALTVAGIGYLRDQGLRQVMLYVESDNTAAIGLYERLGFQVWDTDVQYSK